MLIKSQSRLRGVLTTLAGLWVPAMDLLVPRHDNVLLVLGRELLDGRRESIVVGAANIITDAGDVYYAQSAMGEVVTNNFDSLYLSEATFGAPGKASDVDDLASVIAGSEKAVSVSYPQTNDADGDNTGAGADVMSWLFSYAKGDFNSSAITAGALTVAGETNWGGVTGNPLLSAFNISSFQKTASDTLKVFVNHTINGV